MKLLMIFISFLAVLPASARGLSTQVKQEFLRKGGSPKALNHLDCFLHNYRHADFHLKKANMSSRCNQMADQHQTINVNNTDHVVIVDFTKPSHQRRLFVLDVENPKPPYVQSYYVSHGSYKADYKNTVEGPNKNTIEWGQYFSNVYGSNASSTGFYITGHTYQGRWSGANKDKFSLIVHGVSTNRNDNACDRAIIVHGFEDIKESGPNQGVHAMSFGCFMVDYAVVNQLIAQIRGGGGDYHPKEDRLGGVVFFAYGPTEARQANNYYCSSSSQKTLRLQ